MDAIQRDCAASSSGSDPRGSTRINLRKPAGVVRAAIERFGGVDVLVNNAGSSASSPFWMSPRRISITTGR
jgi:NAD(P)-dependent dehydrogenase (short-subunit alcohol dehydrogenase family)